MKGLTKKRLHILKRNLIDSFKSFKLYKYYFRISNNNHKNTGREIIVMFDGKMKHGGISDRLWGMVSIYKFCKDFDYRLKILFNHPFQLQKYLEPNMVDWEIRPQDISYDLSVSKPIYISMVSTKWFEMYEIIQKKLKSKKQIHLYTNARIIDRPEFGVLFRELFKMSKGLKDNYNKHSQLLKGNYVSCTFRFQQLLGDFKEEGFETISTEEEKEKLINNCKNVLKRLIEYVGCQVLVTSDSYTFQQAVVGMKDIIIVEGRIKHPDFDNDSDNSDVYMKSFLDFFMIANADKVFLCNVRPLYRSGFPETAACIYNKPYYEINSFNDLEIVKW